MNTIFTMPHYFISRLLAFMGLVFLSLPGMYLNGQHSDLTTEDFYLSGDAAYSGNQCFRLTRANRWEGGSIWYKRKIDLSEPFDMELKISLGCNDDLGADGMVFIFHPFLTTGFAGEGMGFGGLYPAFGIEMDTYQNYHLDDPAYDHVAIMQHGTLNHGWGLTEPVTLKDGVMNVEDCQNHHVRILWQPDSEEISFYFDGSLRIREKVDLIMDFFEGSPEVYWGFTSATGDKINRHEVCLEKIEFTETFALSKESRIKLLEGDGYILENMQFPSGATSIPHKAKSELDDLIRFFIQNPTYSIILEAYTDSSGNTSRNQQLSEKRAKAIADYLKVNGIDPNRLIFYGHGEKNPIAPNTSEIGRRKNRRVELRMREIMVL